MKNLLLLALFIGVFSSNLWAQAPQAVCYQALAKDNQNNNILESTIGVRATIVSGGANGVSEWIEVHTPQTDQFGLFTIEIGQGNAVLGGVQSSFGDIEWGNGEYWLRIEFDPFNAGNYQLMGATKIISVPYALYAEGANTANTAIYANSAQTSDTALVALTTLGDDDSDPLNELQTLSFQNGELSILAPDGSLVGAPVPLGVSTGGSLDDSNTNELQNLVSQNGQLFLEDENSNTTGSGVAFDESNTNEIQTLAAQNGELVLQNEDGTTSGTGVAFDNSDTNELQTLSIDGNIISLSGGNSIELNSTDIPFTAPGSSFDLPQGIYGQYVVKGSGSFTVPADKTFWITAGGPVVKLKGLGVVPFVIHSTTPNMPVLPSGQIVQDCMCTGVLVDNSTMLEPLVINFIQDEFYTVPEGKVLFVKSGLANDEIGYLKVNNEPMEFLRSNFTRSTQIIAFPAGTLVEPIASNVGDLILTGFLIDEAF
ncbi:MAG: hypothetical protein ACI9XO_003520 [Paraglaciecola sp.]|jgi:hypothetical protein